jgi:hypothetical protein
MTHTDKHEDSILNLRNDMRPLIGIIPPKPKSKPWYIWEKILPNIIRINKLKNKPLQHCFVYTFNGWVGSMDYYLFDQPFILPEWLNPKIKNAEFTVETHRGRDGHIYKIYLPAVS